MQFPSDNGMRTVLAWRGRRGPKCCNKGKCLQLKVRETLYTHSFHIHIYPKFPFFFQLPKTSSSLLPPSSHNIPSPHYPSSPSNPSYLHYTPSPFNPQIHLIPLSYLIPQLQIIPQVHLMPKFDLNPYSIYFIARVFFFLFKPFPKVNVTLQVDLICLVKLIPLVHQMQTV